MDIMFTHGRFSREADIRAGTRLINPPSAYYVDIFPVREGGNDIVRIGEDSEVEAGEVLSESQGGGGGIDEDRVVGFDALCGKVSYGSLSVSIHLLAFGQGEFNPTLVGSDCAPVDPEKFPLFLESLEILAHSFIGHLKESGELHGPNGLRPSELRSYNILTFNG